MKDYYKLLELDYKTNPSEDDIKRAYKRLAVKYHPDKNSDSTDEKIKSGEIFRDIAEAYTVLSSKDDKMKYDVVYGGSGDNSIFLSLLNGALGKLRPDWEKAKDKTVKAGVDLWNLINRVYDVSIRREEYSIFEKVDIELEDLYNRKEIELKIYRRKARIIQGSEDYILDYFMEEDTLKINVDSLDEQLEYLGCGHIIPPIKPIGSKEEIKKYLKNKDNYGNLNITVNIVVNGGKHVYEKPEFINYNSEYMRMLESKSPWIFGLSDLIYFKTISLVDALRGCNVEIRLPSGETKKSYHTNILQNLIDKRKGIGLPVDNGRGDVYIRFLVDDRDISGETIDKIVTILEESEKSLS